MGKGGKSGDMIEDKMVQLKHERKLELGLVYIHDSRYSQARLV